jgi:hypothetical protein
VREHAFFSRLLIWVQTMRELSVGGDIFIGWLLFAPAWPAFLGLRRAGLPKWLRRNSKFWPWAETTIESGSVELVFQNPRGGDRRYKLLVNYPYSVQGEKHDGAYSESFQSESEAQGIVTSPREMPPPSAVQFSRSV